jgi:hypothetical protein
MCILGGERGERSRGHNKDDYEQRGEYEEVDFFFFFTYFSENTKILF